MRPNPIQVEIINVSFMLITTLLFNKKLFG